MESYCAVSAVMKQIYVLGLLLSMCVKLSCIYEARHIINTNENKIRTYVLQLGTLDHN